MLTRVAVPNAIPGKLAPAMRIPSLLFALVVELRATHLLLPSAKNAYFGRVMADWPPVLKCNPDPATGSKLTQYVPAARTASYCGKTTQRAPTKPGRFAYRFE